MIEENFITLLVAGGMVAMVLMSLATRVGECSLLGSILMSFGLPLSWQGYLSNIFWVKVIGTPVLLLGLALIASDWFEKYEWIQIVLGIPPEERWRKSKVDKTQSPDQR